MTAELTADPRFTATWLAIDGASTNKAKSSAASLLFFIAGTYNASPELREVPGMLFLVAIPPDDYKITQHITRLYTDEMRFLRVWGMPIKNSVLVAVHGAMASLSPVTLHIHVVV